MDDKDKLRLLLVALDHVRDVYEALDSMAEAIERAEDEHFLRREVRRLKREQWERRLLEARN